MTEITQADRDAAAEWGPVLLVWDEDDQGEAEIALAKHFAEHRIKTVKKIAAWLDEIAQEDGLPFDWKLMFKEKFGDSHDRH